MIYAYQKKTNLAFEDVDLALRNALIYVGFGIVTEIDIQSTFREKLGIEFNRFQILGACNPQLANQALNIEPEVAMLIPCNVVFWENKDHSVTISTIDAEKQLSYAKNEKLLNIGKEVNHLLMKAIELV
tara:strand:+ start:412 stop:798 length:387 start_codon:yes stop_codon:yes gene_type:complete